MARINNKNSYKAHRDDLKALHDELTILHIKVPRNRKYDVTDINKSLEVSQ